MISLIYCQDPAGSWLTYAVANPSKPAPIEHFRVEVTVPPAPEAPGGQPAFWIGIEPIPALNLIQPIIPKCMFFFFSLFFLHFT